MIHDFMFLNTLLTNDHFFYFGYVHLSRLKFHMFFFLLFLFIFLLLLLSILKHENFKLWSIVDIKKLWSPFETEGAALMSLNGLAIQNFGTYVF